ncbi:MAG: AAA family ATPase [Candidatus Methanomethylicaceae archaeon]
MMQGYEDGKALHGSPHHAEPRLTATQSPPPRRHPCKYYPPVGVDCQFKKLAPQVLQEWGIQSHPDGTLEFPWPSTNGSKPLHIKHPGGRWSWRNYSSQALRPFGIDKLGNPQEVFIVESERDLVALYFLGFFGIATGGASGWQVRWWGELPEGVPVVVWVEDEAGLKLLKHVVNSAPPGREVRVFSALGLPKKDALRIFEAEEKEGAMDLIQGRLWDARAVTVVNLRDELLERILDSLGRTTGPNPKGIYRSRCPFHDDKNPSFDVGLKGFKCWSPECGVQGSLELLGAYFGLVLRGYMPPPDNSMPDPVPGDCRAHIVNLGSVSKKTITWLWPGLIPMGKITFLDGDPGKGKSLIIIDIAARVTSGRPMPDNSTPDLKGRDGVVFIVYEDDLEDTVRPRVDAAGGDSQKIKVIDKVYDNRGARPPNLSDLNLIRDVIEEANASLLVVDPLMAALPPGIDPHKDSDVRRALLPLIELAREMDVAVLLVRHLNKRSGTPLYRGMGSIGLTATARSALLLASDPKDPKKLVLIPYKNNLSRGSASWACQIEEVETVPYIKWLGPSNYRPEDLMDEQDTGIEKYNLDEAKNFLMEFLRDGPKLSKDILKQAKEQGLSERTLRRAKQQLGITSSPEHTTGVIKHWVWKLPREVDLR